MSPIERVVQLYTSRSRSYLCFIHALAYPRGIRAYWRNSALLRPGLTVLDAGCGTGIVSLALRSAMLRRGLRPGSIKCFDITPEMLRIFRETLQQETIEGVEIVQADVQHLEALPGDWKDFDLIVSGAMMEYLPSETFVTALSGLRARLGDTGHLVLFITRKNWLMKLLIGKWWGANCYQQSELESCLRRAGFCTVVFGSFPLPYKHLSLWGYIVEAH